MTQNKTKYKIGDLVIVDPNLKKTNDYFSVVDNMLLHVGKQFKIKNIHRSEMYGCDSITLNGNYASWHESWLLPASDELMFWSEVLNG